MLRKGLSFFGSILKSSSSTYPCYKTSEAKRTDLAKGEYFWSGANSTYFFVNPSKKLVGVFMTQIASVGIANPYGFYFGDQMRTTIYNGVK